jgi:hypothetical protein
MSYEHRLLLLALARGLDLTTTYLVSPDLRLECNPLVCALGWKLTLWLNLLAVPFLALWPAGLVATLLLSLIGFAVNLNNAIK